MKENTGSNSEIGFRPLPQDDLVRGRSDITLTKQKLGWEPKVPIREGFINTIEYFRELMGERERLLVTIGD